MKARLLFLVLAACGSSSPATTATTPPSTPPAPVTENGKVVDVSFQSDALGVFKKMKVYLPGGYDDAGTTRYPVLYYLHGLGGDQNTWQDGGDLAGVADSLHLAAIIVMPDGDTSFYADSATHADLDTCLAGQNVFLDREQPADYCVVSANYEKYMVEDVVGYVDAHYHTIADRTGRGLAGMSMGGYGALMLGMRHHDVWSAAASHSGVDSLLYAGPFPYAKGKAQLTDDVAHWGATVEPIGGLVRGIFGSDLANWKAHDPSVLATSLKPGDLALYLDVGTEDDFHLENQAQYLDEVLTAHGLAHAWYIGPGRHDFGFWKDREDDSLSWLVAQLAKPAAK